MTVDYRTVEGFTDLIKYLIDNGKELISIQKLEGNLVSIWYPDAKKTEVKK
nr:MAG: hypothetical protein [Microviridae sp.]